MVGIKVRFSGCIRAATARLSQAPAGAGFPASFCSRRQKSSQALPIAAEAVSAYNDREMKASGKVYWVGAGPGELGLLTRRGAELLERAGVVMYEPAVGPEILRLAPAAAERIGEDPTPPDAASVARLLAEKARAGHCVVRLVAGDPRASQRAAAEMAVLDRAGIHFEIVPGVSLPTVPVSGAATLTGTEPGPLSGQRIVVTRSREQAGAFSDGLRAQGAEVLAVPVIKSAPPDDKESLRDAFLGLHEYDWLVFTSVNGVNAFFDYFFKAFQDLRDIGGVRIAAVGPATASRLKELHLMVDAMPEEALGAKVAQAMAREGSLENLRVCLFRAQAASPELPQQLEADGAIVDDIACYKTVAESEDPDGVGARLTGSGADWITFTSGSTVRHFHARFNLPELLKKFPAMRTASIGPETSQALAALSLKPDVEAREHTTQGLQKTIEKAVGHQIRNPKPEIRNKPEGAKSE
jgi:uroporphyrinogen-III synthase